MKTNCFTALIFLFSIIIWSQEVAKEDYENNGLKGDLRVHDPVMIKAGDSYYVFGTGIASKKSTDKITWKNDKGVFPKGVVLDWWKKDIPEQKGVLWAPDIHFRNGKYQMYYSVSAWMNFNSSIGYATNVTLDKNNPDYKWEDHGQVISFKNGGEGVNVIDPNVFVNSDGRVWLLYGSYQQGLRLVELNPKTGKLLDEKNPQLIKLTSHLGEGVFLIKGPEYYYIFASRGICCKGNDSNYQIVMGRSKTIEGPYLNKEGESWVEDHYSLFLAGDEQEPGRGHNGFFEENDTTYIVYHAYTRAAEGKSLLNIKPLYMTTDQWPSIEPTSTLFPMDKFQKKVFIGK